MIEGVAFVCFELTGTYHSADTSPQSPRLTTAMNLIVEYWEPDINPAICITLGLACLGLANGVNVRWYGEIGEVTSRLHVVQVDMQNSGSAFSKSSYCLACSSSHSSPWWAVTRNTTHTGSASGKTRGCSRAPTRGNDSRGCGARLCGLRLPL